jgi:hypothetical protein
MITVGDLPVTSVDGQHLTCLLFSLRELPGVNRRQEVVDFIRQEQLLAINAADMIPYNTQTEPCWMTDIAWARKIGVMSGLIGYDERDAWEIIRPGVRALEGVTNAAKTQPQFVTQCFLWSTRLKRAFVPSYLPSAADIPRPPRRRRTENPLQFLEQIEQLFREGKGERVAAKLTERLGRQIRCHPVACALAHKEWDDFQLRNLYEEPQ